MQKKAVGWFEIYVKDMKRARAFYEGVFAMRMENLPSPDPTMEMSAFPGPMDQSMGASGALVKMNGGPTPGAGTIVYFMCEDCATEAGRAKVNGGKIAKEKFSIGQYGFAAHITDTEGNLIGLHSMK
jgi:predicted enzyme related to lactoylglutathione lyase